MNLERPISIDKEIANYWTRYYSSKAKSGGGLPGFRGDLRFGQGLVSGNVQYGDGFLDIFKSIALPIVKYFGKKGASTLAQVGSDALSGENLLESIKKRGKDTAEDIVQDAAKRATRFIQTGKGHFKRGYTKKRKSYKKSKHPTKKGRKRTARKSRSAKNKFFL